MLRIENSEPFLEVNGGEESEMVETEIESIEKEFEMMEKEIEMRDDEEENLVIDEEGFNDKEECTENAVQVASVVEARKCHRRRSLYQH